MASLSLRTSLLICGGLFLLMGAGLVVAIPGAILSGALGDGPTRTIRSRFAGSSLGVLSARPDMTVEEMTKSSTVRIDTSQGSSTIAGTGVLEFRIAGTNITFTRARFYNITTTSSMRMANWIEKDVRREHVSDDDYDYRYAGNLFRTITYD